MYLLIILFLIGLYHYNYFKHKQKKYEITNYLYTDNCIKEKKKRIIWVHIPSERNERHWDEFASRTNTNINSPFINICIDNLIDKCKDDYDIILFRDEDINSILDETIDCSLIPYDVLGQYRHLSFMKILYTYGGVFLPCSLFLKKSFYFVDNKNVWFICQDKYKNPSSLICGSYKRNPQLKQYIESLVTNKEVSIDYFKNNNIFCIDSKIIGVSDYNDNPIELDHLMNSQHILYDENNVGLLIPYEQLLTTIKYQWFCRLSILQLYETYNEITNYMLGHSI